MAAVISNMASKVNGGVRTGWPVASIDYSVPGVVTLTNDKGEVIRGSAVVSTAPVAVLKRGTVLDDKHTPSERERALPLIGCWLVAMCVSID